MLWLTQDKRMDAYRELLQKEQMDGKDLQDLTHKVLEESLGVESLLHRNRILRLRDDLEKTQEKRRKNRKLREERKKLAEETSRQKQLAEIYRKRLKPSDIKVNKKLGAGAYGRAYLAKFKGTTDVVVKYISSRDARLSKEQLEMFQNEVLVMHKAQPHPNILQLIGCGWEGRGDGNQKEAKDNPFIVSEWMENGSVEDEMNKPDGMFVKGKDSKDEKVKKTALLQQVRVCKEAAAGICHLHSIDIIHRDIGARNMLLDKSNQVHVSDFGLSGLKKELKKKDWRWSY